MLRWSLPLWHSKTSDTHLSSRLAFWSRAFARFARAAMAFSERLPSESFDSSGSGDSDGDLPRRLLHKLAVPESSSSLGEIDSDESLDLVKVAAAKGEGVPGAVTAASLPSEIEDDANHSRTGCEKKLQSLPDDEDTSWAAGDWQPGQNAGQWISRSVPLSAQARVLVANVYLVAKRLPSQVLSALAEAFWPPRKGVTTLAGSERALVHLSVDG